MAFTYERKIDALGGVASSDSAYDQAYNDGYSDALTKAGEIAADADAMIAELIETIDDVLQGRPSLKVWVEQATLLLQRIQARQS